MKKLMMLLFMGFFLTVSYLIAEETKHKHHEEHDNHNDHEQQNNHDEHEEDSLTFSPAQLKEFSIKLSQVTSGIIYKTLTLSGEVAIDPRRVYHLSPKVSGTVSKIYKHLGDSVKKGDLLMSLVSRERTEAKAELISAKSLLDLAELTLARERSLFEQDITAKRDYWAAQQVQIETAAKYEAEQQHLLTLGVSPEMINAILNKTDKQVSLYHLYAPKSGVITAKNATEGEVFDGISNRFTLTNLEKVWVNLTVYQKDLALIHQGQTVSINTQFTQVKKTTTQAKIQWISPILDEKTRSATARVTLNNPHRNWRPGLFVNTTITLEKAHVKMMIPHSALQTIEGKTVVFVQHKKNEFEPQAVLVGRKNKQGVEITKGLTHGQTYVSEKAFILKAQMQKESFGHGHSH
jgi:cobalt-zinc-cadmium efflux system membrane fusion protein